MPIETQVRADLVLVQPEFEHCYCVGDPRDPAATGAQAFSRFCKDVGQDVFPERVPMGLSCMGHSMGFASMVDPLVSFVLETAAT